MSTQCSSRLTHIVWASSPTLMRLKLGAGELTRFEDRCGLTIVCGRGELWITQSGDARDIFLVEGQSFALDRNGRAVVQALTDSEIQFVGERV